MLYSVKMSESTEYGDIDSIIDTDLKLRDAIKTAKQNTGDKQIFITWFRAKDGQHGYYNPDGNHSINGKSW